MRKLALAALAMVLIALAYIAYPFATAWAIKEAIREGDAAYLESKIEWDGVRSSLGRSLLRIATAPQGPHASAVAKRGLWQRIKAHFGERAVASMVTNYVTPEGLPQLFGYRKLYRDYVSGEAEPPWRERFASFWQRMKRAEFKALDELEIEMADRHDATRHYVGLLRLRGLEWKLASLEVVQVPLTAMPLAAGES